jgi:DNA-directed RNA polymerase subunit E'/Rpb7
MSKRKSDELSAAVLPIDRIAGTCKIRVHPQHLDANIHEYIKNKLKKQLERKWTEKHGYVERVTMLPLTAPGRVDTKSGYTEFTVQYRAEACKPHVGQRLRAHITLATKLGIHFETAPLQLFMYERQLAPSFAFVDSAYRCAKTGTTFSIADECSVVIVGTRWSDNQWVSVCVCVCVCVFVCLHAQLFISSAT